MNGNGSVWKWLAAFLAGVVVAMVPSLFVATRGPTKQDFQQLQIQIAEIRVQTARLEEKQNALIELLRQQR